MTPIMQAEARVDRAKRAAHYWAQRESRAMRRNRIAEMSLARERVAQWDIALGLAVRELVDAQADAEAGA